MNDCDCAVVDPVVAAKVAVWELNESTWPEAIPAMAAISNATASMRAAKLPLWRDRDDNILLTICFLPDRTTHIYPKMENLSTGFALTAVPRAIARPEAFLRAHWLAL